MKRRKLSEAERLGMYRGCQNFFLFLSREAEWRIISWKPKKKRIMGNIECSRINALGIIGFKRGNGMDGMDWWIDEERMEWVLLEIEKQYGAGNNNKRGSESNAKFL